MESAQDGTLGYRTVRDHEASQGLLTQRTVGNRREPSETVGTVGNRRKPSGTVGNRQEPSREPAGTVGNLDSAAFLDSAHNPRQATGHVCFLS